jgi:hypothetical protein
MVLDKVLRGPMSLFAWAIWSIKLGKRETIKTKTSVFVTWFADPKGLKCCVAACPHFGAISWVPDVNCCFSETMHPVTGENNFRQIRPGSGRFRTRTNTITNEHVINSFSNNQMGIAYYICKRKIPTFVIGLSKQINKGEVSHQYEYDNGNEHVINSFSNNQIAWHLQAENAHVPKLWNVLTNLSERNDARWRHDLDASTSDNVYTFVIVFVVRNLPQ